MMKNDTHQLLLSFFLICLCSTVLLSQSKPDMNAFRPEGDAEKINDRCFQLTPAYNWSGGSVWHKEPISLSAPFDMELNLMMGCDDFGGADGMVFVFHTEPSYYGYKGEGIGFGGLVPSLGIEVDTWRNHHLLDPAEDHIAVLYDGNVNHRYGLAGPVKIRNVEDCKLHALRIKWNPAAKTLEVYLDGSRVIALKHDIIHTVFRDNDRVYWGVTAATGAHNNRHQICFEKLDFKIAKESRFDHTTKRKILKGDVVSLENVQFGAGQTDLLPLSRDELDKLVELLEKNPDMDVDVIGHTDSSGNAGANKKLSEERAEAVEEYLVENGIDRDRINARGYGESYPIASNGTSSGRLKNRRIEIIVSKPVP